MDLWNSLPSEKETKNQQPIDEWDTDINVNQNIDINQREHVGIYKVINLDIFWLMRILTSLMMFWFSQLNPVKRITI
jgi:hypothetical protein